MEDKKWYLSKTIWTNIVIAMAAAFAPPVTEFIKNNPEMVALIWAGINGLLRLITNKGITKQIT